MYYYFFINYYKITYNKNYGLSINDSIQLQT